jgi:hypothetical protein
MVSICIQERNLIELHRIGKKIKIDWQLFKNKKQSTTVVPEIRIKKSAA